jgi:menaquinone-dependent protoporphyrinogen IX oxidase
MSRHALVVHASRHGHSAEIARRVAATLGEHVPEVRVHDLADGADPDPAGSAAVVVVASVHIGRHPASAVDWIVRHRAALEATRTLLLSVTLTAAEDSDEARTATAGVIAELLETTGWRPDRTEAVAGAIQWQAYGLLTRLMMRFQLRRRSDVPRDRSRDVEYTDWVALDGAVRELGRTVADDPCGDAARPDSYARTP